MASQTFLIMLMKYAYIIIYIFVLNESIVKNWVNEINVLLSTVNVHISNKTDRFAMCVAVDDCTVDTLTKAIKWDKVLLQHIVCRK